MGWYYFFLFLGLTAANDAAGGVYDNFQSLIINSTPFTFTAANGLDHVKYLVLQKSSYNAPKEPHILPVDEVVHRLPKCGIEIVYEGIISVTTNRIRKYSYCTSSNWRYLIEVNNVNSEIRIAID